MHGGTPQPHPPIVLLICFLLACTASTTLSAVGCIGSIENIRIDLLLFESMIGKVGYKRWAATRSTSTTVNVRHLHLHSQGCGVFGALGQGDDLVDSPVFRPVVATDGSQSLAIKAKMVSAGWAHSAVLSTDGNVFIFGRPYDFSTVMQINRLTKLSASFARAVGRFTSNFGSPADGLYSTPHLIDGVEGVASVHCAAGLTLIRKENGDVYAMGQNRWGQCGVGNAKEVHIYEPIKVLLPVGVGSIDVGLQHGVALSQRGTEVYTWGKGNRGQLGLPQGDTYISPQKVPRLPGPISAVSAGFNHTAVLTSEGVVYVWGKGMSEKLKSDTKRGLFPLRIYEDQMAPRRIDFPSGQPCGRVVEICSSNFTLVIRCDDGSLWAMGLGEYDRSTSPQPLRVQQVNALHDLEPENPPTPDTANSTDLDQDPPVVLPPTARLRKGFQRVVIVTDTPSMLNTSGVVVVGAGGGAAAIREGEMAVYEVVIHAGEAFLKVKRLQMDDATATATATATAIATATATASATDSPRSIVDYSTGWQHSLLIVQ